jgi:hypothetical protein
LIKSGDSVKYISRNGKKDIYGFIRRLSVKEGFARNYLALYDYKHRFKAPLMVDEKSFAATNIRILMVEKKLIEDEYTFAVTQPI